MLPLIRNKTSDFVVVASLKLFAYTSGPETFWMPGQIRNLINVRGPATLCI